MNSLQDLRYAGRLLVKSPGFTATALLTLAIGIGANASVFSVVSAVLLRPLPWADSGRIVFLTEAAKAEASGAVTSTSYDNFLDWEAQSKSFEAMAIYNGWEPALTGMGEAEKIKAAFVTAGIFDVLRVSPALGRAMRADENRAGSPDVAVVSDGFWRRRLGADPRAVGRVLLLNAAPRTIVGVLPAGFRAPMELDAEVWGNNYPDPRDGRSARYLRAIGRLKPGVSLDEARAEMRGISGRLEAAYPKENTGQAAIVTPIRQALSSDTRGPLLLLLAASALVLLIACANLSNLLIARGVARSGEIALRTALGASRARTVRQLLTESSLLAVLGGGAALLLAPWATDLLVALGPESMRAGGISTDWRVLAFTLTLTVATMLLFGLLPALRLTRAPLESALKEDGRAARSGIAAGTRGALAVAQLALALTLLFLAGLLVKSFQKLQRVDPGIRPDNLLVVSVNLPESRYPKAKRPVFFEELVARVGSVPGVRDAAVSSIVPFSGGWDRIAVATEATRSAPTAEWPEGDRCIVSERYFSAMRIPIKEGRGLSDRDRADAPPVAVVDEVFARRLSPRGSALGTRLWLPQREEPATIVGVVGHVKHYGLDASSKGQIYMSHRQYPWRWMHLVVRSENAPERLVPTIRARLKGLDPEIPLFGVSTIERLMADRAATRRFSTLLVGTFAGIAAALAGIGLFGVIAYTVSQRLHEIAIRIALGAQAADVLRMIVRQGLRLAGAGVALGLAGAAAGSRLLAGLLFGVGPADPVVLGAVSALLLLVAVSASYLPARRAARVDPASALRAE